MIGLQAMDFGGLISLRGRADAARVAGMSIAKPDPHSVLTKLGDAERTPRRALRTDTAEGPMVGVLMVDSTPDGMGAKAHPQPFSAGGNSDGVSWQSNRQGRPPNTWKVAEQLPSRPVLTSVAAAGSEMVLQRCRHPPSTIDSGPA